MSQDHVLAHIRASPFKCERDADVTHCTAPQRQRHVIVCIECISAVALRVAPTVIGSDTHVVLHVVVPKCASGMTLVVRC